jgi:general nucleoside transport system ATP-binding protein
MTNGDVVVRFDDVTKVYPPAVRALAGVSVTIEAGEIHAFVGENGAGKSTLMKVLNGEVRLDAGSLRVFERTVSYSSASDAMADGIGMVHQEILLVDQLTVWENIVLGVEPVRWGIVDADSARSAVVKTLDDAGLELDPNAIVGELTIGARQKVEIAKLLHRKVRILILDEPTAVLTPQEIPELFDELRQLRDAGSTICFISHHLDEVVALADRITVLRDGAHIATVRASTTSVAELARLMVERDVVLTSQREPLDRGEPILEIRALTTSSRGGVRSVGPIDLVVHEREIVGVAGVEGNGQEELFEAIIGARPVLAGSLRVCDTDITAFSILDRRRFLAYVPAERKTEGGALNASLIDNVTMTHHRLAEGFSRLSGWFLDKTRTREFTSTIRRDFSIASTSVEQTLGSLSGGNQQKVILGRELSQERPLVVLNQPTRGVDIGSTEEIHKRILHLRAQGRAVMITSADLDELQRLCDRIVVMFRGHLVLDVAVADASLSRLSRALLEGVDIGVAP